MSSNSVSYYYEANGLPSYAWQVFYNFSGMVGNVLPSVSGANPYSSGIGYGDTIINGAFDGNSYLRVSNSTGGLNNWSIICSFQKHSLTDAVLFSSFSDGQIKSGFAFGVTASNRLFVESYDENGPVVLECPTVLANKNVVALSKIGQSIYFDYLNPNTQLSESYKAEVSDKGFLNSNNWSVGGAPDAPAYAHLTNFSGVMHNFLLINDSIRPTEIQSLFQGICSTGTGIPVINSSYLSSLGMNRLAFFGETDSGDAFDVYAVTGQVGINSLNIDAIYDGAFQEFYGTGPISGALMAFLNGVAQVPHSGYQIDGTYYDPIYSLTGNFVPSGSQFFSNRFYTIDDNLVYDNNYSYPLSSYSYNFNFSHDGITSHSQTQANNALTDLVFFEGVKLSINVDYIPSTGNIVFQTGNPLYEGMSGMLMIAPRNSFSDQLISGAHNLSGLQTKFTRGTSQVWLNGLRQNLDEDYIEVSDIDPLSKVGIFPTNNIVMFNDDF